MYGAGRPRTFVRNFLFLRARRGFQIHPTRLDQNCLRFGTKRLCYEYLLPLLGAAAGVGLPAD